MSNQIDTKAFTEFDQQAFAEFSGDYNPIHMDDVYARRSITGYQIVHGMHLLIWAIDSAARTGCLQVCHTN